MTNIHPNADELRDQMESCVDTLIGQREGAEYRLFDGLERLQELTTQLAEVRAEKRNPNSDDFHNLNFHEDSNLLASIAEVATPSRARVIQIETGYRDQSHMQDDLERWHTLDPSIQTNIAKSWEQAAANRELERRRVA